MSREGSYDAFIRWAQKERNRDRNRPCIFCGYPTRSESQTCPAHRDLAPPIENLLLDEPPDAQVRSSGDRP